MDHSFGSPFIYTDTIHNAILFIDTPRMLDVNSLIMKPYLAIIASNDWQSLLTLIN